MKTALRALIVGGIFVAAAGRAEARIIPQEYKDRMPLKRFALDVGGGSLAYVSGNAGGGAGSWTVVAGYTPWRYTTLEAGYTGAAGAAAGSGSLVASLVEGGLRVNPIPGYRLSPYLVAGVGWGAFHESQSVSDNATLTVPLGAGLEVRMTERFNVGGRLMYRIAAFDRIGPTGAGTDNWSTMLRVGAKF